jgi:hypothetical protein
MGCVGGGWSGTAPNFCVSRVKVGKFVLAFLFFCVLGFRYSSCNSLQCDNFEIFPAVVFSEFSVYTDHVCRDYWFVMVRTEICRFIVMLLLLDNLAKMEI